MIISIAILLRKYKDIHFLSHDIITLHYPFLYDNILFFVGESLSLSFLSTANMNIAYEASMAHEEKGVSVKLIIIYHLS